MATLGVIGKSQLESVANQLHYKVTMRSNWFISLQILCFYTVAILALVMNSVLAWMRTTKVDPYAPAEYSTQD